ncbi:hypothetical protein [Limosilactobacillus fermentum]|uniref:hypothetical protein n=1 Tax=Limosilactobacillus fermentum TaxID=1613 RepID=UPI00209C1A20|nr:hypothetical protein [Limosilactobacillus fermentum]MCO8299869.1 hypothetical protein [Limosilactobacillus fermentum]
MIKLLYVIFEVLIKFIKSEYESKLKAKTNDIEHVKNSENIEELYNFTVNCASALYGNTFGDVRELFRSNQFDEMKDWLSKFEFQTCFSKKTLRIWNDVFIDMENVFDNYEKRLMWKRNTNSGIEKYSYYKENELSNREKKDKSKLKKDIKKLKSRKELRA